MSALGHKRTYAVQKAMSALPPIATAKADMRKWSCPLYPRKQTCAMQMSMSAWGKKRTFAPHEHKHKRKTADTMPVAQSARNRPTAWCDYYAKYQNAKTAITTSARTNPVIFRVLS